MHKLLQQSNKTRRSLITYVLLALFFIVAIWLLYIFLFLKPSNNKQWDVGFDRLSGISRDESAVTIKNFRDFTYVKGKQTKTGYREVQVNIQDVERVWFMYEPFTVQPFTTFGGIAHTYFTFDFKNHEPLVVSVEARREKGENYSTYTGAFNKFELQYIWGSETDFDKQRAFSDNDGLYMFPLQLSTDAARKLFLQMVDTSIDLEKNPRFYNSLTSNCTNELAKNANDVRSRTVPFDKAWIFPGYSDEFLYRLKLIPTDKPLEQIREKYYVTEKMKELDNSPHFSEEIRKYVLSF